VKIYKGFPHGMCTTNADTVNLDLLGFIQARGVSRIPQALAPMRFAWSRFDFQRLTN
jgi:hypothetical protein